MKNPLSYQSTEYDCGPTSLLNAINYLFPRQEIYPDVIKSIMLYCLDGYNSKGEAYKSGTTRMAMLFLSNWLNQFGEVKGWPIKCSMLTGDEVFIGEDSNIIGCLQQGGVAVVKVMLGEWHYILLTGTKGNWVYAFDPYFRSHEFKNKKIRMIYDEPKKMNRKIAYEILNSTGTEDYALSDRKERECVLIYNTRTRRTEESIDYII